MAGKRKNKNNKPKTFPQSQPLPSSRKQPKRSVHPDSYLGMKPSWRISQIEMIDPFGWHTLDASKMTYIREKISNFESMTWDDILLKGKKHHHSVQISTLAKEAQQRLTTIQQEDIDELVSLRLSNKERIWGILEQGVLRLLWWDPEHKVCPSLKKRT